MPFMASFFHDYFFTNINFMYYSNLCHLFFSFSCMWGNSENKGKSVGLPIWLTGAESDVLHKDLTARSHVKPDVLHSTCIH